MRYFWRRIWAMFGEAAADRDLEMELESHLEMRTQDFIRRGMTPEAARREARIELGGSTQLREAHRETRGLPAIEALAQDIRYAMRALGRAKGFTALAVLTLSTGIGINTAVFSVFNAAALRPIQAVAPERVMQLAHAGRDPSFSSREYLAYRDLSRSFTSLAAVTNRVFSMSGAPGAAGGQAGGIAAAAGIEFPRALGAAEPVVALAVSGNYFRMLGASAALGRVFLQEEDAPGAQPVALMSDNFWERRFARDPTMLGRKLALNGMDATVVGILPPDFGGTSLTVPDLWVPLSLAEKPGAAIPGGWYRAYIYGRLAPGVSAARARQELDAIEGALPVGARPERLGMVVGAVSRGGQPGDRDLAPPLILLGASSLVLLIACANVAGLLLARSAARQREIAIRLAIGASRWRLIRQLLTESAVLSLGAGALGVGFSWWALRALLAQMASMSIDGVSSLALNIAPDHRVLAYMVFLALGATLVFGLAPALECSRANVSAGLKDEAALFGLRVRKSRLRGLMVGTQVAVSLILLICAGLLTRASQRALQADLGFDYDKVISLEVVFPAASSRERIAGTRAQLAEELKRLPEVESVAVASRLPLVHGGMRSFAASANGGLVDDPGVLDSWYTLVTPGYFQTLRLPIVRGRNFTEREARDGVAYDGSPALVSEATAAKLWPGEDALGKRLAFGPRRGEEPLADGTSDAHSSSSVVVGVVKDVRSWRLERIDATDIYLPVTTAYGGTASGANGRPMGVIALRARISGQRAASAVRQLLQARHPDLQVSLGDARTAFSTQNAFLASRMGAAGAGTIGLMGLLMTCVGIYGTVAFAVAQRTQEIGVRMALGASRQAVLLEVLAASMRPVAIGLAIGALGGMGAARAMHSILFGLGSLDPIAFTGAAAFLAVVALAAGFVPARRATRVDPMTALRYE